MFISSRYIHDIIANISKHYHLQAGDSIFTGTPEGGAPVVKDDHLQGAVQGEIELFIQ